MARIRSVKPELRRSLTVSAWSREVRYAWVLLWGYLDDYGYGVDDLRLVTSDLFPLDRDITERKMDRWLTTMAEPHGDEPAALCRFQVAGRSYLHAIKWAEHQRPAHPTASRYPACPVHGMTRWPRKPPGKPATDDTEVPPDPQDFTNGSGSPPESLANGSGETQEVLVNDSRAVLLAPARGPAETGDGRREVETGAEETGDGSSSNPSDGPSSELTQPRETADHPKPQIEPTGEPWLDQLAEAVLNQRPMWSPNLIVAAARRAAERASPQRVTVALMCVAGAEDSRFPHRVLADGWWWDESDTRYQQTVQRLVEVSAA